MIWWILFHNLFNYSFPHFHILDEKRVLYVALAHLQSQLGLPTWRITNHRWRAWSDGRGECLFESGFCIVSRWRYYAQTSMIFGFVEFFGHDVWLRILQQICFFEVFRLVWCFVSSLGYFDVIGNQINHAERYSRSLWLSKIIFWIWPFGYLL